MLWLSEEVAALRWPSKPQKKTTKRKWLASCKQCRNKNKIKVPLAFLRGKDASASLSMLPLALTLIPERFLTGWFCSTDIDWSTLTLTMCVVYFERSTTLHFFLFAVFPMNRSNKSKLFGKSSLWCVGQRKKWIIFPLLEEQIKRKKKEKNPCCRKLKECVQVRQYKPAHL